MKVLRQLAHVMWDHIGDLSDDADAQRVAQYAEESGTTWNLVEDDAGLGVCHITGQMGNVSIVEEEK